jgi:NAD(P)-dependent dehydrogenase (short-subunit alcohol dehydrogenase family)
VAPGLRFEGKVALVMGGASGIGRGIALAFGSAGASVVVADVDVDGGQETAELVRQGGSPVEFVRTDVSSAADVVPGPASRHTPQPSTV